MIKKVEISKKVRMKQIINMIENWIHRKQVNMKKEEYYLKGLRKLLLAEQARLEVIKRKLDSELVGSCEGTLRITKSNGYTQYYHHSSDATQSSGRYLPKTEKTFIRNLAQKSYDRKLIKLVERRLHQLKQLTQEYNDDEIEEVFNKQAIERKCLVNPVEPTMEQIIDRWLNEEYTGKGFSDEDVLIYSEKGERVRSKTEKIIADYLYRNNIPYKYEKPLVLKGYGTVYPDFTLLPADTYEEIYWEHDGRMDDPVYASNAVKKIKLYEENGMYIGNRLILTFETQKIVLNTEDIRRVVKRFPLVVS